MIRPTWDEHLKDEYEPDYIKGVSRFPDQQTEHQAAIPAEFKNWSPDSGDGIASELETPDRNVGQFARLLRQARTSLFRS